MSSRIKCAICKAESYNDEQTYLVCKRCYWKVIDIIDDHSKYLDKQRTNEISNIQGRYLEGGMAACREIKSNILGVEKL